MNCLIVSVVTVAFTIILAMLFSYSVARLRWKRRRIVQIYMSLGMFIPVQAILIPVAKLVNGIGLNSSRFCLIFVYTAINLSFTNLVFYGSIKGIPEELEEADCMDGANIFVCFFRIIVPLLLI